MPKMAPKKLRAASRTAPVVPPAPSLGLRRAIEPGSKGQAAYLLALRRSDLILCDGLAGTGKTFLAVAAAVAEILTGREQGPPGGPSRSLVISRPAVTAHEDLGFLPGNLHRKVEPYLVPILDAMAEYLGDAEALKQLTSGEASIIRTVPLGYMRGRTFRDCWVLLDEAQNATPHQVEMFLSRIGVGCKAVVVGDTTQSDLGRGREDGLAYALARLEGRPFRRGRVAVCRLGPEDIMRSDFMAEVLIALRSAPAVTPPDPPATWKDAI